MKHKVAELEGALLDAPVAMAEGLPFKVESFATNPPRPAACWLVPTDFGKGPYSPSSNWSQGGPIIERERIMLIPDGSGGYDAAIGFCTGSMSGDPIPDGSGRLGYGVGPTPLIAAMRAYVAAKLGEEVELP